MQEVWLPVAGWEGLYEVSNMGRVRRLPTIVGHRFGTRIQPGKILKGQKNKNGYWYVGLASKDVAVKVLVHRLVAKHFLPPTDLPEANHDDLNKDNNRWDNLEWTTRKGNAEHAARAGRFRATSNPNTAKKLTAAEIPKIIAARNSGRTYVSIGGEFGVCRQMVANIVLGKAWRFE